MNWLDSFAEFASKGTCIYAKMFGSTLPEADYMRVTKKSKTEKEVVQTTFDLKWAERSVDSHLGRHILKEPDIALIELIANAWDASAMRVDIELPNSERVFSIQDDGSSMTPEEFEARWGYMGYDRIKTQGIFAEKPPGKESLKDRRVYGKNGRGRFAALCFSPQSYHVETKKAGVCTEHRVYRTTGDYPIRIEKSISISATDETGTRIFGTEKFDLGIAPSLLREQIGMRFLVDPDFKVFVDGVEVTFEDVANCLTELIVDIEQLGTIHIKAIDTSMSDRDTRLHGVAWRVKNRLVGQPDRKFIDGRRTEAKRFNFIVEADILADVVQEDWTGFKIPEPKVSLAFQKVDERIQEFITSCGQQERREVTDSITQKVSFEFKKMTHSQKNVWQKFIEQIQIQCPGISEKEIESMGIMLAKLEVANSKYALLSKLKDCQPSDFDSLNEILNSWNIEAAHEVLDELKWRLEVIAELESKMLLNQTDEVHDLQPIFDKGLWIFGPEFEAIEFKSNRSMSTIIRDLFKLPEVQGSANRPDFIILAEGGMSIYDTPRYDGEIAGVAKVVIVELKKPSVKLTSSEKMQCMKYAKELLRKGVIQNTTVVQAFLLGKHIDPFETEKLEEGLIQILPFTNDTILQRAKSRTLTLYERVKQAPFLADTRNVLTIFDETNIVQDFSPGVERQL